MPPSADACTLRRVVMPDTVPIELAIRQWARSDAAAVEAVASVDAARLKNVEQLYSKLGLSTEDAQARAVLLYSFIFGQSLLFLEQASRKRASLIAVCADVLTDVKPGNVKSGTTRQTRCDRSG